jgi:hypothetical protein
LIVWAGSFPSSYFADQDRAQRHTLGLRDVAYLIRADVVLKAHVTDDVAKYRDQFRRRVERPVLPAAYLGCREFPADFGPADGSETAIDHTDGEMERLTPRTPEDYLFLGQALASYDPARALRALDEAVRRPSVIARLARAEARYWRAQELGDAELAAGAVEDAGIAGQLLPESSLPLSIRLQATMTAALLHEQAGRPAECRRAREEARDAFAALGRFAQPDPAVDRFNFLRSVNGTRTTRRS